MEIEHRTALKAAVGALEAVGVDYFLFGANAHNVWGDPRFTTDADFIVFLPDERFEEALAVLEAGGFEVEKPRHLARLRTSRMAKLRLGRVTVDFVLGETEFDRSARDRRVRVEYLDVPLLVASAEDVVLYKLIAHRARDLADIESIVRRQRAALDRAYLRKWAKWLARETGLARIETTLREMLRTFGGKRKPL